MKSIIYYGDRSNNFEININIDLEKLKVDINEEEEIDYIMCEDCYISDVLFLENKNGKFIIGEEDECSYIIGNDDLDINVLIDIFGSYNKIVCDFDINIEMIKNKVVEGIFNFSFSEL